MSDSNAEEAQLPVDARLRSATRLLAEMMLLELDAVRIERLREPELSEALRALGVEVPAASELDALAAEFFETFLHPKGVAPPVQSLWTSGGYEGDSARAVRELAAAAGFELNTAACRDAAPDHAAVILLLWCEASEEVPEVAERLRRDHLAWIPHALAGVGGGTGFYASVARCVVELVAEIRADSV